MRTIFLCFLLFCADLLSAQNPIKYSLVVQTPDVTAEQAFKNVELWIVNSFNNPGKVIQLDDPNSKRLVMKASTVFKSKKRNAGDINGYINYVINVSFREGRLKMEMVSMSHEGRNPNDSFGILTDEDIPNIKIPFASKKWKSEIYTEMKETAKLEWNTILRCVSAAANKITAVDDDNW